ncbi:unnamed protein product [Rotaria sp. Silwood1]|nr:unnamed protein product [Rotaria sp. Silwood1]
MANNSTQYRGINPNSNSNSSVFTNHFTCSFADKITLYQYDVVIEEKHSKSGDWVEVKSRPKCSLIMQSFIHGDQLNPQQFVWYDEKKCLYSTTVLSIPLLRVSEDNHSRIQIKPLPNQWSTNDINEYVKKKKNAYPKDAMRILETLLKRSVQDRIRIHHNTCYFLDREPEDLRNGFERRMTDQQSDNEQIPTPQQRYDAIRNALDVCNYNSNANLLCRAVGFDIDCNEMLEVDAKILPQPKILSGPSQSARIHNGHIYTMGELNIVVNHYECKRNPVENTMQKIDEYFHSKQAHNYDFLVCIMNDRNSNDLTQLKHRIKLSGTVYYGK